MPLSTEARGPALGYLYQVAYALLLLLESDSGTKIYIEKIDDIQIEREVDAREALQLKHSNREDPPPLTDRSTDFWKTLANWCELSSIGKLEAFDQLTLISVASMLPGSMLDQLRQSQRSRNNKAIQQALHHTSCETNPPQSLQVYFAKYKQLPIEKRENLIEKIRVIDRATPILDVDKTIKKKLQEHPRFLDSIYEHLWGWWTTRVHRHLCDSIDSISKEELNIKLHEIREQYRSDNLPLDFSDAEPPSEMFRDQQQLRFVQQLTVIEMSQPSIENAIRDYYRAFRERTKWLDDKVVDFAELIRYEKDLIEHWSFYCERLKRQISYAADDHSGKVRFGQTLYDDLMLDANVPAIRPMVKSGYIKRGHYQILAHGVETVGPRVWWHPEFVERLQELLPPPKLDGETIRIVDSDKTSEVVTQDRVQILPSWTKRPVEIAHLLNPAFGAVILYDAIAGYESVLGSDVNKGFPYPLLYFVFPAVLIAYVRNKLPKHATAKLHSWLEQNPDILPIVQAGYIEYKQISDEALRFGLRQGILDLLSGSAQLITIKQKRLEAKKNAGGFAANVTDIRKLATRFGKILAHSKSVVSIYAWFGVKP